MKVSITKGLNVEESAIVKESFNSSATIRHRLSEILGDKINTSRSTIRMKEQYNSPSWAFNVADQIGYERALSEVIDLISSPPVD